MSDGKISGGKISGGRMYGVAQCRIFIRCQNVLIVHNVVVAISRGGGMTVWRNVWVAGSLYGMKSDGETLCDIMSGG